MSEFTITIVGTGAIGTSIGLALKARPDPPRLLAHDKDLRVAQTAVKRGAFDKAEWNLINACEQADLIILATPLSGLKATFEAIGPDLKQGVVITDTTPNKQTALQWAAEFLPEHVHFIGGNPIVHPEGSGPEHASAGLFSGRLYCLTPGPQADEKAVQLLVGYLNLLGAEPFFLDATEHDGLVTATEHLPALVSLALVQTLAGQQSWREARKLAGGLFERVSAGASSDPEALKASLHENRANLRHWLEAYLEQLHSLYHLLDGDEEDLLKAVETAVSERDQWAADLRHGDFADPELQSASLDDQPGFMKRLIGLGR